MAGPGNAAPASASSIVRPRSVTCGDTCRADRLDRPGPAGVRPGQRPGADRSGRRSRRSRRDVARCCSVWTSRRGWSRRPAAGWEPGGLVGAAWCGAAGGSRLSVPARPVRRGRRWDMTELGRASGDRPDEGDGPNRTRRYDIDDWSQDAAADERGLATKYADLMRAAEADGAEHPRRWPLAPEKAGRSGPFGAAGRAGRIGRAGGKRPGAGPMGRPGEGRPADRGAEAGGARSAAAPGVESDLEAAPRAGAPRPAPRLRIHRRPRHQVELGTRLLPHAPIGPIQHVAVFIVRGHPQPLPQPVVPPEQPKNPDESPRGTSVEVSPVDRRSGAWPSGRAGGGPGDGRGSRVRPLDRIGGLDGAVTGFRHATEFPPGP